MTHLCKFICKRLVSFPAPARGRFCSLGGSFVSLVISNQLLARPDTCSHSEFFLSRFIFKDYLYKDYLGFIFKDYLYKDYLGFIFKDYI